MLVSQGPIKNGLSVIQVFMSVVSRGVGVGGKRERKTASCWEASQCPLKREIGKKKSNMDEGDARMHTHARRHTCLHHCRLSF